MSSKAQILEVDGEAAFAIVPIREWRRLQERMEALEDVRAVGGYLERPGTKTLPAATVWSMAEGESPLRAWRKHRDLTLAALARRARISVPYLSQLETGKRLASQKVLQRLARSLDAETDDLL